MLVSVEHCRCIRYFHRMKQLERADDDELQQELRGEQQGSKHTEPG